MNNGFDDRDYQGYTYPDEKQQSGGRGVLVAVVFIAAVIGMLVLSQTAPIYALSLFGGLFAFFGIIVLTDKKNKYPEERFGAAAFLMGGIITAAVPFILKAIHSSGRFSHEDVQRLDTLVFSSLIMAVGISVIIFPAIAAKMKRNRCTYPVTATCVELRRKRSGKRRRYIYAPVWQYSVGSGSFTNAENTYSNINVPQIGQTTELLLNPDDPNDFLRENRSAFAFMVFIGLLFAGIGFIVMLPALGILG